MRYSLRTLLILMAIGPPFLAGVQFAPQKIIERYRQWQFDRLIHLITTSIRPNSRWEQWGDDGEPVSPVEPSSP